MFWILKRHQARNRNGFESDYSMITFMISYATFQKRNDLNFDDKYIVVIFKM